MKYFSEMNRAFEVKKKLFLFFAALVCAATLSAEIVKINNLYFSLGTTTATVTSDQTTDKSVNKTYTTVTIPASVTYNNYTYPVKSIGSSAVLRAVYESSTPTNAPEIYTNPANPAQKLIRDGNVYILTDDKTYTVTGLKFK